VYEQELENNRRLMALLGLAVRVRRRKKAAPTEKQIVVPVTAETASMPPAVSFAVEQRSGGDPSLRRYLHKFAQEQLSLNKSPEEIAETIRMGDGEDSED
jgi:hypothetical protein